MRHVVGTDTRRTQRPAPKRRSQTRRRRQRRAGYGLYLIAALLLAFAGWRLLDALQPKPARVTSGPEPATTFRAFTPTLPDVAPTTAATPSTVAVSGNTPPVIHAPDQLSVGPGRTAIGVISIDDAEASRDGTSIGVLLSAPDGALTFGSTAGLTMYGKNGASRIPFTGSLGAVNAALRTLSYEHTSSLHNRPLQIFVTDYGGGDKQKAQTARRIVDFVLR